jgi:D-lactate dehydrogenase
MEVAVFSAKNFEKQAFDEANTRFGHGLHYFDAHLTAKTASLALGMPAVSAFVNDTLNASTLEVLARSGCRIIALRSAGYNHVDLEAARLLRLKVVRVPAYSPHAIAEHTIGLMLTLNRKIHRAYNRVREGNFSLEGLIGFDMANRAAGVVGTGKIGIIVARILVAFGCQVFAFDPKPNAELEKLGVRYLPFKELLGRVDVLTLHCPLTPQTKHLIDHAALASMRPGAMLINTGRGALIDTRAVIGALKSRKLGYLGLDVYEEEEGIFFEEGSDRMIGDDVFARLLTFPNVLVTGHQAFLTEEALRAIAVTSLESVSAFEKGEPLLNQV